MWWRIRFNEAAVFRLRMAAGLAAEEGPTLLASMRPQSFDCGWPDCAR